MIRATIGVLYVIIGIIRRNRYEDRQPERRDRM